MSSFPFVVGFANSIRASSVEAGYSRIFKSSLQSISNSAEVLAVLRSSSTVLQLIYYQVCVFKRFENQTN